MKILYVVGEGAENDYQELRWSLRSLCKNLCNCCVEPVIVGSVPDWFVGDSIKCDDPYNRKAKNIFHKIATAITSGLVSGEFMFSADDHFYTRPQNFDNWPRFFRNSALSKYIDGNNYCKALDATRETLLAHGYPIVDLTGHNNTFMNADDLPFATKLKDWCEANAKYGEYGIVPAALFGNLAIANNNYPRRPIVFRKDWKLGNVGDSEFARMLTSSGTFSINDEAFKSGVFLNYMNHNFSEKSRWEK